MIYLTEQKNDAEAVKWYRKAADQDDDQGQWFLGNMYLVVGEYGRTKSRRRAGTARQPTRAISTPRKSWVLFTSPDREWCRITLRQRSGCERRPTKATVPPREPRVNVPQRRWGSAGLSSCLYVVHFGSGAGCKGCGFCP